MKLQNHAYPRRFAVLGAVFAAALFGSVLLGRFSVTPKELFRLLLCHPEVEISAVSSVSFEGQESTRSIPISRPTARNSAGRTR